MTILSRVHLNGLRAIETAGRRGTLQRAAEELGVTPGAVSQHILKAEQQLGRSVFERTVNGLVPTEFGRDFLALLADGFRLLERAVASAETRSDTLLTVSVAPVFAAKWLVPRLSRFAEAYPHYRVRIDANVALVDPRDSDVDVTIRVGRGPYPGLVVERLMGQEVFPVCAPALASRLRTPADLLDVPTVYDAHSVLSWNLWLGPHGLGEDALLRTTSFSDAALCLDATIAGQGVMLAWQTLAHDALRTGAVVAPFAERAESGNAYFLITAPTRRPVRKLEDFRRWMTAEIAETASWFGGAPRNA